MDTFQTLSQIMTTSDILKRYDMTTDNKFIIRANIPSYASLFEDYDYTSSFYKRDLNEKLVDYLLECAQEIGNRNEFVIHFDLPATVKSETEEGDNLTGFKNYFDYLTSLSRKEIGLAIRRMLIHLAIAVITFFLWLLISPANDTNLGWQYVLLSTGLAVAIWVLILTGLSRFIFRLQAQWAQIRLYKHIKASSIQFNYIDEGDGT